MGRTLFQKYLILWIGLALTACSSGVQTGSVESTFAGVGAATALSPTSVKLTWTKNDKIREYRVYEAGQSVELAKTIFDNAVIENLNPDTVYTFKVVGDDSSQAAGLNKEIVVRTWPRFNGVATVTAPTPSTILATWDFPNNPMNYLVFIGVNAPPTAATTTNWTVPTLRTQQTSYLIQGVQPSTTYYVVVQAQYRDEEFERSVKTLSLRSGTTFQTPIYFLSPISIGSLPYIIVDPVTDASHLRSEFRTQAFWNGNAVSDPLQGAGTLVFSANAGLPIGKIEGISLRVEYGSGATMESQTIDGLTTYIKGVPSHIEKPAVPVLSQGASYFGKVLARGDFNCDGGADLAVGVPDISLNRYGVTAANAGAVFIYYSKKVGDGYVLQTSPEPLLTPANQGVDPQILTFDDLATDANFGYALAAGNMNEDKLGTAICEDLAVGAPATTTSGGGAAYVFFGSQRGLRAPAHIRDMPINTETCDGRVEGASCVAVRIVQDYSLIPTALTGGTSYGPGNDGGAIQFGAALAFVGDFDANGYDDLAVGSPYMDFHGVISGYGSSSGMITDVGMVSVFSGSKFGLGTQGFNGSTLRYINIFPPIPEPGMHFGSSIAGKGDVDGRYKIRRADGVLVGGSEMIIGAPDFKYQDYSDKNPLKTNTGTTATAGIILPSASGWAVGGIPLSATTNYYGFPQNGSTATGAAFLYYGFGRGTAAGSTDFESASDRNSWLNCGSRSFGPSAHFSCLASQSSYSLLFPRDPATRGFGRAVALVGDSSRFKDNTNDTIELRTSVDPNVPYFYYSDANGDGYADVIVTAPATAVSAKAGVGTIWQFFGNPSRWMGGSDFYNVKALGTPVPSEDYIVNTASCAGPFDSAPKKVTCAPTVLRSASLAAGAAIGASPSQISVGDVTGDGLKDVVIGAAGESTAGAGSGAVLIYPSAKNVGLTSTYKKIYGQQTTAGDGFGSGVTVGNFNGDYLTYQQNVAVTPAIRPLMDVFGGAPRDGSNAPAVGTVLGFFSNGFPLPSVMSTSSDGLGNELVLKENQASFQDFGVGDSAIVGDINADGYEDAVSKISEYLPDGTLKVDVAVYFGSSLGLVTTDFCLNNKSLVFKTGQPDSTCYPSITPLQGVTNAGFALPQRIVRPASMPANWMSKAVRAGDVNKDGFADVLLTSNTTGKSPGRQGLIILYLGSSGGLLNVVDPSFAPSIGDPQIVSTRIAFSVYGSNARSSADEVTGSRQRNLLVAGDFNHDGFQDLVVGDPTAASPAMNQNPGDPTYLADGETGVASGGGWNCPTPECQSGQGISAHGLIYVFYGSERGYQTPANQGMTITDFAIGDPGTIDMLDTERPDALTKPCVAVPGAASTCQVGYFRNPMFENIAYGYDRLRQYFGASVASIKVNKDDFDDILIGVPDYTDIGCWNSGSSPKTFGRIYILYGSNGGLTASIARDYYAQERTGLACPVPAEVDPAMGIRADSKLRAIAPMLVNPLQNSAARSFGLYMGSAGDVNGDGFEELLVNNPYERLPDGGGGWVTPGSMFLYYGPLCPMDNDPFLNEWFQSDLASGNDVKLNKQTYVQVGPPGVTADAVYSGVFSNPAVTATCVRSSTLGIKPVPLKFTVLGASSSDRYGFSYAQTRKGKGDFNGDGFDDVLVGSHIITDQIRSIANLGQGVVFFGSENGLSVVDYPSLSLSQNANSQYRPFLITPKHTEPNSYFFRGNISAGDVNNDHTVDYMVTSRYYSGTGAMKGINIGTFFLFY